MKPLKLLDVVGERGLYLVTFEKARRHLKLGRVAFAARRRKKTPPAEIVADGREGYLTAIRTGQSPV